MLIYEASRDAEVGESSIHTPVAKTVGYRLANPPLLVPVLRAGLGMADQAHRSALSLTNENTSPSNEDTSPANENTPVWLPELILSSGPMETSDQATRDHADLSYFPAPAPAHCPTNEEEDGCCCSNQLLSICCYSISQLADILQGHSTLWTPAGRRSSLHGGIKNMSLTL